MTTDARRLMRPGAVASMEHSVVRLLVGTAKLPDLGSPRAGQRDSEENGCPYEGSSRMRGNFHVRFGKRPVQGRRADRLSLSL